MKFSEFQQDFRNSFHGYPVIGTGEIGGKAQGLIQLNDICNSTELNKNYSSIKTSVPSFTIICTDCFDSFMKSNELYNLPFENISDETIASAFQSSSLPTEILGELRNIAHNVRTPLAVRSSSLLEDKMYEPFAGVYATKMISNNQVSVDQRFNKLTEAVKFVYASTFFKSARNYIKATNNSIDDEKMAVILQHVAGNDYDGVFYPMFSGVARSYNYYSSGRAKPEDGVVSLALGLGKSIVDGDLVYNYSPRYPKIKPPFKDNDDFLKNSQLSFWAVNLKEIDRYNPISENEFLQKLSLDAVNNRELLKHICSTYISSSDKFTIGIGHEGPRVIDFAPLLSLNEYKFNNFIINLLKECETKYENAVELEFAVDLDENILEFKLLQIRPMVISKERIEISEEELTNENNIIVSENVLGNGSVNDIKDIILVKKEVFDIKNSQKIAVEIEKINNRLRNEGKKYLLIGFGRWGSSDPWLGIPVKWSQITNAQVIVESTLPQINVDYSQGSHFFHNLTSFQIKYLSVKFDDKWKINWDYFNNLTTVENFEFVKHLTSDNPLKIKIDGIRERGIIHI